MVSKQRHRWFGSRWMIAGSVVLLTAFCVASQQPTPTPAEKQPEQKAQQQPQPTLIVPPSNVQPASPDKTVAFEMRDRPWKSVFEWLSTETGLPVNAVAIPSSTFTYYGQPKKRYTIPEVIDVINENLLNQKFILIRRDASFTVVPADQAIDPAIVPRIRVEDLSGRGMTEIVSIVVDLKSLIAEDAAPEIKKMMGPFGEIIALTRSNQLVLQDTVKTLQRVVATINVMEKSEKNGQNESFSHECKYIKVREAERILKELLGDVEKLVRQMTQAQGGQGQGGNQPQGKGGTPQAALQLPKFRPYYITADERTNTVLVTGPPDKIAQAREIMNKIDVPQPGQKPFAAGPPVIMTYPTSPGAAEAVVRTLQEIYKSNTSVKIASVNGGAAVMVMAGPDDQFEIARLIGGANLKGNTTELIPLGNLDADKLATTLKGMFQTADGKGAVSGAYIEADVPRNSIIVKGTPDQVSDVKLAIKALGEGENAGGNVRIITLEKGGASALAAELERLMGQMRNNPVKIVTPGGAQHEDKPAPKEPGKGGPTDDQPILTDPNAPKKGGNKPVTITVVGNKLIITSEDPEALKLANELTRLLTSTTTEGDFEIIHLKNAIATDAAKVIDEAFNGTKAQPQTNNNPGFGFPFGGGRFGAFGGGAATTTTSTAPRVRVVADPASNSLLIKASPADMLQIRYLLKNAIDSTDEKTTLTKTFVIGPLKYSKATTVADVIRDIYKDSLNSNNTQVGGGNNRNPFFFGGQQNNQRLTDASGNPRPAALTVTTEDQTNSLIVHCSDTLYKDISKLVETLELTAKGSPRSIKIISIKGLDPEVLERAIDALHPQQQQQNNMNNRFGNQFGGGRGGFGGGGNNNNSGRTGRGNTSRFNNNNRAAEKDPGGPENFEAGAKDGRYPANMDDANDSILFDPNSAGVRPVGYQEQSRPPAQPGQTSNDEVRGPLGAVHLEALREIGALIISAENKEDLEEIMRIVKIIQESAKDAEVEFQLLYLKQADATNLVSILNNLFSKVVVGPQGNIQLSLADQQLAKPTRRDFGFGFSATTQSELPASVILIPLPRFNAILVGAPKSRLKDVLKEIERLDQPTAPTARATAFPLKKAPAGRVAALVQNFYASRYPNETDQQNQIRVTSDDASNTVFVQAAPADLAEIRDLINRIDNSVSSAINDVQIIKLRNALSDELANTLLQSITQGVIAPSATAAPGIVPRPGGNLQQGGQGNRAAPAAAPSPIPTATGLTTKSTTLRFYSRPGGSVESGLLEDVHITSEPRSNSLIVSAPPRTMELIQALIRELDIVSSARAEMKIFTLKKADAENTASLLQQLFFGAAPAARPTGATGPGLTGPTAAGATSGGSRPLLSLSGNPAEGATLVDLKISVDPRSNSIIVAGSRNDLEVIEALISRIDDAEVEMRRNDVYRLHNATAADVANALTQFLTNSITVLRNAQQLTAYQEILREVVIVPEPISNSLLISATPKYYDDLMRIIAQIDEMPPQVLISVVVAQVDLTNQEEFGVEVGLQSPVLFQRSITNGVTVNASAFPQNQFASNPPVIGAPGFNFNTTGPLPNSTVVGQNVVGFQGLSNLGVGRTSRFGNFGGLIFSAGNDAFNVLIRSLKIQQRIDILSRPQVMTLDNQQAAVNFGREIPIVTNTTVTATGLATQNIERRNVGVLLKVTPRITPDGKVLMRVFPEISSVDPVPVNLGNGNVGTALNVQQVETTVSTPDGETVVIGGMITTSDTKEERKIPLLGDLPWIGSCFRYRAQERIKRELLVILTPHIVRSQADADRLMLEEARRMDWVLGDLAKVHGKNNLGAILPQGPEGHCTPVPMLTPSVPMPTLPSPIEPVMPDPIQLPPPQPLPGNEQSKNKSTGAITPASHQVPSKKPGGNDSKKTQEESKPWVFRKDF